MIDQFKAEKCLHATPAGDLVLMIIDNKPDPGATPWRLPRNSDSTNPGTRDESRWLPGGC